jgi:hypothetical protein
VIAEEAILMLTSRGYRDPGAAVETDEFSRLAGRYG